MKLYVIRHGESETNRTGCYTGWMQIPLTEKGFEDADNIRPFLENIEFDKVYTSDLIRAKQTAETALPGCTYEETPLLREINLGSLSGQNIAACREKYGAELVECKVNSDYRRYGGECYADFAGRINTFLADVASSGHSCVAAFSHAGAMRTVLDSVLKMRLPRDIIRCKNCTIAIFEYVDGKWYFNSWISTSKA